MADYVTPDPRLPSQPQARTLSLPLGRCSFPIREDDLKLVWVAGYVRGRSGHPSQH